MADSTLARLLCHLGIHAWEPQHHPGLDGEDSVYLRCHHCGKEAPGDGPPISERANAFGKV